MFRLERTVEQIQVRILLETSFYENALERVSRDTRNPAVGEHPGSGVRDATSGRRTRGPRPRLPPGVGWKQSSVRT